MGRRTARRGPGIPSLARVWATLIRKSVPILVVLALAQRSRGSTLKHGVRVGLNHPDLLTRGRRGGVKRLATDERDRPVAALVESIGSIGTG
jgi:hypothetical protein